MRHLRDELHFPMTTDIIILITKQQEEAPMGNELEDAVTIDKVTVPYNPNLLVTYKAIAGTYAAPEEPTYLTSKVTDIEWDLHNGRTNKKALSSLQSTINTLEEQS
jgi:hypothetical protein